MKKIAFALIVGFIFVSCVDNASQKKESQNSSDTTVQARQTTIDGLGKFKIDKTDTNIIKELEKELRTKTKPYELFSRNKNNIFLLVPGGYSYPEPSLCPDVKEYIISEYNIADIKVENLKLKFYKSKLFDIGIRDLGAKAEIVAALKMKYGEPEMKKDVEKITCINNLTGNKVTHDQVNYYETWRNGDILASRHLGEYYNSKCENIFWDNLDIFNSVIRKSVKDCEDLNKQGMEEKEKQKKMKKIGEI